MSLLRPGGHARGLSLRGLGAASRILAHQVLDRPATGRVFFEEVIRENLDIGRPSQVQVIFDPAHHAADTGARSHPHDHEGRHASLHLDYKRNHIKQYHKEGRALRTETTINYAGDFAIGRTLTRANLALLRH